MMVVSADHGPSFPATFYLQKSGGRCCVPHFGHGGESTPLSPTATKNPNRVRPLDAVGKYCSPTFGELQWPQAISVSRAFLFAHMFDSDLVGLRTYASTGARIPVN